MHRFKHSTPNALSIEQKLAMTMIEDVLKTTGVTAIAGGGTDLYLCKVAMDMGANTLKLMKMEFVLQSFSLDIYPFIG